MVQMSSGMNDIDYQDIDDLDDLDIAPEDESNGNGLYEHVYEDDQVIVVNKAAGMVVHPGCGNYHGTLVNAIAWHLRDNPDYDPNDPQVGLVHRIDKDTSGLLVVAKTPEAKTNIGLQFFNKTTKRMYRALVWGAPDPADGTIMRGTTFNKYKQFINNCFSICPRQALHAMTLGFTHPTTGKEMFFTSPLPEDMELLLAKWRDYTSNRETT